MPGKLAAAAPIGFSAAHPTTARYRVIGFVFALGAITYLDRVCISILAPYLMKDLSLTKIEMSWVFGAFTLAYGLFEIPVAWWGDRSGARSVLIRIVSCWSAFTALTGAVFSYASLLGVRFLFGMCEAGAWPMAARAFSRWIPKSERGFAQSMLFVGAHLAGGLTPSLVTALLVFLPWRAVFVLFGCVGLVWVLCWSRWFRNEPADHPQVNAAELELIAGGRTAESHAPGNGALREILTNRSAIFLCLMYFANGFGFFFLITWLPTYLREHQGFHAGLLGLFSGLPLILSVVADLTGGLATDWLSKRYGLRLGRAIPAGTGYLLAGVCIFGAVMAHEPVIAALLIALGAAFSMFTLGASWAACIEIGGPHVGVMSASMNMMAVLGGFLSPIIVAFMVDKFSNWTAPLYLMAILYVLAAACWLAIDPRHTLQQREAQVST